MERGELPRDRLLLSEALGDEASLLALRRSAELRAQDCPPDADLVFWGRRLGRFGPAPMVRIAGALARALSQRCGASPEVASLLQAGLEAADAFLQRTPGVAANTITGACEVAAKALARAALKLERDAPARRACQTLLPLLRAAQDVLGGGSPDRTLLDAHYLRVLEQAQAAGLPQAELQAAIREEVVPWALGLGSS